MSATDSIRNKLIKQAVKKLKRFGFVNVSPANIMLDDVYKFYFDKIIRANLGQNKETDNEIHELLEKIKILIEDSKELKPRFSR